MSFIDDLVAGNYQITPEVDLAELSVLYDTPQEKAVHAEGSVGVHTEMTLEATERLLTAEPELDPVVARLAAVFHDVGKPQTTKTTRSGRIAAPGHEEAGFWLLGPLFDTNPTLRRFDIRTKAAVRALVREHLWSYNIDKVSRGAAIRLSHLVDPRHAYALWRADVEGRICDDQARIVDGVEYSWEMLKEWGADQPEARPYQDEAAAALGYEKVGPQLRSELLRAVVRGEVADVGAAIGLMAERRQRGAGRLIYMIGLPGGGKSTLSGELAANYGWTHLSYDADRRRDRAKLRAENWRRLEEGLRAGETMLVDATHLERRQRDPLIAVAYRHRAEVGAVLVETTLPQSVAAQQGRATGVPEEALVRMTEKFRYPTPDEYAWLVSLAHKTTTAQRVASVVEAVRASEEDPGSVA